MTTTTATTSSSTASAATAASPGNQILTALGAGSGIDTSSLITGLVSASFDPKTQALQTKVNQNSAQISSLGTLTSGIDAFASALNSLISGGTLYTQATSSDSSVITATAQPGAQIGGLSSQISVRQLAQAQSLVSGYFASTGTTVGAGGMTLSVGGTDYPITLDSSNDSLAGIARAINATNSGVTASVITDSNGARLALKGATGAANAFTLTPASGADAGLAALAYPAGTGGTGMTQAQAAQDAIVRLDGVDVSRPTNKIGDLIDGVTLNLVSANPNETVSLGASVPTAAISQAVSDFVDAYNTLKGEIDTATAATTTDSSGNTTTGPLYGNSAIRQMQNQLSQLTSTILSSGTGPRTLADLGVSTNRDGTLSLDSTMLNNALTTYPDGVEAMFNPTQHSSSPLIKITSAISSTKPGTYALTSIVAGTDGTSASGQVNGSAMITTGTSLFASVTSAASGLVIEPQGDVASATVTVDLGLGGALQAIRDSLRATGGVLDALSTQLTNTKTDLTQQQTDLSTKESDYQTQLTNQFATMNTRVAAFKATQSYLTQQIAVWTNKNGTN